MSPTERPPEQSSIPETIEAVTDSAVEIAQIEAETTVELAEIHADVELARIEAEKERVEPWQEAMTHLRADLSALAEAVTATAAVVEGLVLSTPQPSLPATEIVEPEAVIITSETPTETSSEIVMEVPAKSVEKSPAEVLALARRKVRMI